MYQLVPKKKKYIVLKIVGVLFACAIIKELLSLLFAPAPVSQQLHDFANSINKRCPIVIDSTTVLNNCAAISGYRLHFNYQINTVSKEDVDTVALIMGARQEMITKLKTDPNMVVFKNNDLSISATYYDKTGAYICSAAVVPSDLK
jgi:hypothetical protein